jgi:HEAT repeat protein
LPIRFFCRHCWYEHSADAETCPSCGSRTQRDISYREALELALACPEALTARRAAYLLGKLRDPKAVPALARALAEGDPYVAAEAVIALGKIEAPEARALVAAARHHRYVTVRREAERFAS